ncbi:GNAT family N-acetyltransferase [Paracoccaceae bacterium]|nr:GNAT family N-acetyltransferase [Paracoccaceae bacterium]
MPAEQHFNLYKKCVDIHSIQFTLEDFKRFWRYKKKFKIVEEKNGIAILGLTDSEIEIYFIGVEVRARGKGIGKKLMENIIRFSEDYGANEIILEVGIDNMAAKNLYISLNFKKCGIRKNYYKSRLGLRQDAILMKLNLKA